MSELAQAIRMQRLREADRKIVHDCVATKIQTRRRRRGLSMGELAHIAGMSKSYLIQLEALGNPTAETLVQLALVFDCEPAELLPTREDLLLLTRRRS